MRPLTQLQQYYLNKAAERDLVRDDIGSQGGMIVIYSLVRRGLFEYVSESRAWRIREAGRRALRDTDSVT